METAALHLLAFLASFVFIGLKSIQQLNVVHHKLWWILPTSFAMAVVEVFVIATVAQQGWGWIVFAIGLGGGLGSIAATMAHRRLR